MEWSKNGYVQLLLRGNLKIGWRGKICTADLNINLATECKLRRDCNCNFYFKDFLDLNILGVLIHDKNSYDSNIEILMNLMYVFSSRVVSYTSYHFWIRLPVQKGYEKETFSNFIKI